MENYHLAFLFVLKVLVERLVIAAAYKQSW